MIIKKLEIRNFKSIDDLTFNPKMVNILVGRNNTGKTSLLESISLPFTNNIFQKEYYKKHPAGLICYGEKKGFIKVDVVDSSKSSKQQTTVFRLPDEENIIKKLKSDYDRTMDYATRFCENYAKTGYNEDYSLKRKFTEEFKHSSFTPNQLRNGLFNAVKDCIELIRNNKNEIVCGKEYYNLLYNLMNDSLNISGKQNNCPLLNHEDLVKINTDQLERDPDQDLLQSINVIKKEDKTNMVSFIDPVSEIRNTDNFTEVNAHKIEEIIKNGNLYPGMLRFNFENIVINGADTDISMETIGNGFKSFIGLLLGILIKPKNSVVLLEEPEIYMHPKYISEFVKNIIDISMKDKIQFFISTNSMDFIDNLLVKENFSQQANDFIRKQLLILRQNISNNGLLSEIIDYKTASDDANTLSFDLRGV